MPNEAGLAIEAFGVCRHAGLQQSRRRVPGQSQYAPILIASGIVRFWPPVVTTSACGPATAVELTVSIALIEVAAFTTTLLTASIPLGTVTVSPLWKLVFAPVMVTVM
jgi:hypothetical protein